MALSSSSASTAFDRFAVFIPRVQPSLERFARKAVGDFAEDVVQDTILAAFSNLNDFDFSGGEDGASQWLFAMLQRRIANAIRQHAREKEGIERYAERRRRSEADAIARRAMRENLEGRLEAVRPRLTNLEATALEGYIAGESDRIVARRLDVSRQAVNRAKLSALDKCRDPSVVARPALSAPQWRAANWEGGNRVTIYHAPQRTGAGLAKMTPSQRAMNLLAR